MNGTQSRLAFDVTEDDNKISIIPVLANNPEVWPDNGFATLSDELIYYDAVDKDINGKVSVLKRCSRGVEGTIKSHRKNTPIYGNVVAQHHNQLVEAIIEIEKTIGQLAQAINRTVPAPIGFAAKAEVNRAFTASLHNQVSNMFGYAAIGDDMCPEVQFEFNTAIPIAGGTTAEFCVRVFPWDNSWSYKLDFGDGTQDTVNFSGTHEFQTGGPYTPIVTITTDKCTIVQQAATPNEGYDLKPSVPTVQPFHIYIPEVPDFPSFVAPRRSCPGPLLNMPPILMPQVQLCSTTTDESVSICSLFVSIVGLANVPSVISVVGCNFPSTISFEGCCPPSVINFAGCCPPSVISFEGFCPPSVISFAGCCPPSVISFEGCCPPSVISFAGCCPPSVISFAESNLPSVISIVGQLETPSAITIQGVLEVPSTVTIQGDIDVPSIISIICCEIPTSISITGICCDLPSMISITCCDMPSTITITGCNIPSVISLECCELSVTMPSIITIDCCEIPSVITVIGDIPSIILLDVPSAITIIGDIPNSIELIGSDIPSSIELIGSDIPSSIELIGSDIPSSITIDCCDLPSIISIIGCDLPSNISLDVPSAITVISDLPSIIEIIGNFNLPSAIEIIGNCDLPSTIEVIGSFDLPSIIEIIGCDLPSSITLDIPSAITVIGDLPSTIEIIGNCDLPSTIEVIGSFDLPSTIEIIGCDLPSVISLECCAIPIDCCDLSVSMPSSITIDCCDLPSVISIIGDLPSVISFDTPPTFESISFDTPPTFGLIGFDTPPSLASICFCDPPTFEPISFTNPPALSVDWGTPPTVSCIVTVVCPASVTSTDPNAEGGPAMWGGLDQNDTIPVTINDIGIPEEIKVVVPKIPDIKVFHDIPNEIALKMIPVNIPDIKIIGPATPLPTEIQIVGNIPEKIKLVATDLPKSISLDATNVPKKILIEPASNFPSVIKLETAGIPTTLQVTGIPSSIELVGTIPSTIQLVMPEDPTIELVYKGAPLELGLKPEVEKMLSQIMLAQPGL